MIIRNYVTYVITLDRSHSDHTRQALLYMQKHTCSEYSLIRHQLIRQTILSAILL